MHRERLGRVRGEMDSQGVSALVLMHVPHLSYAAGHVPAAVDATHAIYQRPVAIVTGDEVVVHALGSGSRVADLRSPLWPELAEGCSVMTNAIADVVGPIEGRTIAVDEVTGEMRRAGVLDGATLVEAGSVLDPCRLVKTPDELACLAIAQRRNEAAMERTRAGCRPGTRRSEVAGLFLRNLYELGGAACFVDPVFDVAGRTRAAGPPTATGHIAVPTAQDDPSFAEGDMVWVETSIGHEGYMSDYGRTWLVGRDPTPGESSLFERWAAVIDAVSAATGPQATLGSIARAARKVEEKAGHPDVPWLAHLYLAHGVGVEYAELPMIGTEGEGFDDSLELEAGMVLAFEPVVWERDIGGYRAGEVVAVTTGGCELLGGGRHDRPFAT